MVGGGGGTGVAGGGVGMWVLGRGNSRLLNKFIFFYFFYFFLFIYLFFFFLIVFSNIICETVLYMSLPTQKGRSLTLHNHIREFSMLNALTLSFDLKKKQILCFSSFSRNTS